MAERSHIDTVATLDAEHFIEKWFESWKKALDAVHADNDECRDVLPLRETVLEAFSDASPEQLLTPLMARDLRRCGRRHFAAHDLWFWARSEWARVDISYGLAPRHGFDGEWNPAWKQGITGDLGQIEVKVCYTHRDVKARIDELVEQLERRAGTREHTANRRPQQFHGLVWIFQHRGCDRLAETASRVRERASGLKRVVDFGTHIAGDLGLLWPAFGAGRYTCGLDLALFELVT